MSQLDVSAGKSQAKTPRSPARPTTKATAKKVAPKRKTAPKPTASATTARKTSNSAVRPVAPPAPPAPVAPPKKPSFYEAIAIYESGVRGLQRHDYISAAESFRQVLERYPEERELVERARLYLRVCERETAERPHGPRSTAERVYAATMSLSAGDSTAALAHVQRALAEEPRSPHAHYMMAVIRSTRAETAPALEHLRLAIELNPNNRSLARKDVDLQGVRHTSAFKSLLEEPTAPPRSVARSRSK